MWPVGYNVLCWEYSCSHEDQKLQLMFKISNNISY
jgi:hypothetical protein